MHNIAVAYSGLSRIRNKKENLEISISYCKQAKDIYLELNDNDRVADCNNNLGTFYTRLAEIEEPKSNLSEGLKYFQESIHFYNKDDYLNKYLSTSMNIATSYCSLAETGNKADYVRKGIDSYVDILKHINIENDTGNLYSTVLLNLGTAYLKLAEVEDSYVYIKKAIANYEEAINHTPQNLLKKINDIKFNMGDAYRLLSKHENKEINLNKSLQYFNESFDETNIHDEPIEYAKYQNSLGKVNSNIALIQTDLEEKKEKFKESIKCFDNALKIYKENIYHNNFIKTTNDKVSALIRYSNILEDGEKKKYLSNSIDLSNSIVEITNEKNYLFSHSGALLNLGIAYSIMSTIENKDLNKNKAIEYYKKVITLLDKDRTAAYFLAQDNLEKVINS